MEQRAPANTLKLTRTISLENLEQLVNEELMPLPDAFYWIHRTKGKVKERLSYYMPKFAVCVAFLVEV